jgi:U3 small nucleolar RNA-associated protein 18
VLCKFTCNFLNRYNQQQHAWATRNIDDTVHDVLDHDDLDLLNQSNSLVQRRIQNPLSPLPAGNISIKRLADATVAEPSSSGITATHFHPNSELILVASQDKHLKVFKIDEDKNEKQLGQFLRRLLPRCGFNLIYYCATVGLHFKDILIRSAKFVGKDGEIVVSGRKPYYYSYDAVSGKITKLQCE